MLEEEEEEDPDEVYFSTDDLLQVRKSIFLLFKNILRLLQKFSLKEKPQCLQNCLQVIRFYSGNLMSSTTNTMQNPVRTQECWQACLSQTGPLNRLFSINLRAGYMLCVCVLCLVLAGWCQLGHSCSILWC